MRDQCDREIDYMRISVTDRCNLHCSYCRPEENVKLAHSDILSYEEILRICSVAVQNGIDKFKITGGEPFARKSCIDFIRRLKRMDGVNQVTVTTNGTLLSENNITELKEIGIDGMNISLDTAKREMYKRITGADMLHEVMHTIDFAYNIGLNIKINTVIMPGVDMRDIEDLLDIVKSRKIAVRFIEEMPMGHANDAAIAISGADIRRMLTEHGYSFKSIEADIGNGPAKYYSIDGYDGIVGFIEPIHGKFCDSCNRVRLTSTGFLKLCLYHDKGTDLRKYIRDEALEGKLLQAFEQSVYAKPAAHEFEKSPSHCSMDRIGG